MDEKVLIIEGLEAKIADCEGENQNDYDWLYRTGVLISANDARLIIKHLRASQPTVEGDALKCGICGKRTPLVCTECAATAVNKRTP